MMAPRLFSVVTVSLALYLILSSAPAHQAAAAAGRGPSLEGMYAWGDSLTDTGNYQLSIGVDSPTAHLPYGQTFFHYPTGRASDGRLVVDFLAKQAGLDFLLPYLGLNNTQVNSKGKSLVNFAVGGATTQNVDYLNATYNISVFIPYSLDKQVQWFSTLPISKDKDAFSKALIYFGPIGGNDYTYALQNGFSLDDIVTKFVPNVIKIIQNALELLIASGAKYLVVEGGYPIGCTPVYTKLLCINAATDEYGCVEELQSLNAIHDKLLKELVYNLTTKYNEDVHLIYFDQLKAYAEIIKHPSHYGFINTTDPCFDTLHSTNLTSLEACSSPSTYVSWDGRHFTEATHNVLFNLYNTKGFVTPYPNFLTSKLFKEDSVRAQLAGILTYKLFDKPQGKQREV
ncbi:hypothetical protein GOP47_0019938 [Adiantum capillus-veneris]|uniref:GDSL esterase/lipase n=1 Tax=Adiantum capillus-veneris TaxID=13818 RepID=A0A9D4Z7I5_ADICA|nr:hypothetical protein GOP47_0019938 [Adiantum capillus-veneris]